MKQKPKKKGVSSDKENAAYLEQKRQESILGQKKVKKNAMDAAYAGRLAR